MMAFCFYACIQSHFTVFMHVLLHAVQDTMYTITYVPNSHSHSLFGVNSSDTNCAVSWCSSWKLYHCVMSRCADLLENQSVAAELRCLLFFLAACWETSLISALLENSINFLAVYPFSRWKFLIKIWSSLCEDNDYVRCLMIDFSKAFDTVDHVILILKLIKIGVPDFIVNWIWSFLTGRSQQCKVNGRLYPDQLALDKA